MLSYPKAWLLVFPFAFVGSLLTVYFVIPGFDKNNTLRLITVSGAMGAALSFLIAFFQQKVQFELPVADSAGFTDEFCRYIESEGGRVIKKTDTEIFIRHRMIRAFEIKVAINSNTAVISGSKLWLSQFFDKLQSQFSSEKPG